MKRSLLLLLSVSGCSLFTEPNGVTAIDFTPPAYYAQLWRQIDSCSGQPRSMAGVRFAVAISSSPDSFYTNSHGWVGGLYESRYDRIILTENAVRDSVRRVVSAYARHEMLHAHMQGIDGHPAAYFGSPPTWTDGKCGVLVSH